MTRISYLQLIFTITSMFLADTFIFTLYSCLHGTRIYADSILYVGDALNVETVAFALLKR